MGMHPRQASLLKKVAHFHRKAYQALPWGIRIADLLYHMAFDAQADIGRSLYSIFISRGVTGLPDIKGEPALSYPVDVKRNKLVPPGYGKDFGHRLWRRLLAAYKDPELVSDALQTTIMKLLDRPELIADDTPVGRAEKLVFTMAANWIKDQFRTRKRHREDSLYGEGDDGEEQEFAVLDKNTLRQLDDMFSPSDMRRIMRRLDREVHPDASLYVELLIDGYNAKEVVGDKRTGIPSMLPHVQQNPMSYQNWDGNIKPKIRRIILEEQRN